LRHYNQGLNRQYNAEWIRLIAFRAAEAQKAEIALLKITKLAE